MDSPEKVHMTDIPVHSPRGQFTDHTSLSGKGQNSSIINDHSGPLGKLPKFISSDISSASSGYARNTQIFPQETHGVVHSFMAFSTSPPVPIVTQGDSALPLPPLISLSKRYVVCVPHTSSSISGVRHDYTVSGDNSVAVTRPQIPEVASLSSSIPLSIMPASWKHKPRNEGQTPPQNNFAGNTAHPSSIMVSYPDKSVEAPQTANRPLPQRIVAVSLQSEPSSFAPSQKGHVNASVSAQPATEVTKLQTKGVAVPFALPQSAFAASAQHLHLWDNSGWSGGRDSGASKGTSDSLRAVPQVRVLSQHRAMARARTRSGDEESEGGHQHHFSRGTSSPGTGHTHSRSYGRKDSHGDSKSGGRDSSHAEDSVGSLTVLALMRHSSHDPREPSTPVVAASAAAHAAAPSVASAVHDVSPTKRRARSMAPTTAARASMLVNRLSSTPFSPQHLHTAVASAATATAEKAKSAFLSPVHVTTVPLDIPVDEQSPSDTDSSPIEPHVETYPCRVPTVRTGTCLQKPQHTQQSQGAAKASVAGASGVHAGQRSDKQINNQGAQSATPALSLAMFAKPPSVKVVSVPSPAVTTSSPAYTPAAAAIATPSVPVAPASMPHTRHTRQAAASPAASRLPSSHPTALPLLAVTLPPSNPGSPASIASPFSSASAFHGPSPRSTAAFVQRPQSMPPRASITRLNGDPSYVPRAVQRGLVLGSFARQPSPLPITPVPLAEARPVLQPSQASAANAHSRTIPRISTAGDASDMVVAVGPLPPATVSVRPRGRHSRPVGDAGRGNGEAYEDEGGEHANGAHGRVVWGEERDDWSDSTVSPLAVANLERSGRYDSTPTHSSYSSPHRSDEHSALWRRASVEEVGQRLRVVIPPLALPPAEAEVWDGRSYTVKASPKDADGRSQTRYQTRHLVGFGEDEDSWYSGMTDEYGDSDQDRMYYAGSDAAMGHEDSMPERLQGGHAREWFDYGEGYGVASMKDAEGYCYDGAPFRSSRGDDEYEHGYEYGYDAGYNDGYGDRYGRGCWVDTRAANGADAARHPYRSPSRSSASRSHSRPAQPPYASSVSTSTSVEGHRQRMMNTDGSAWEAPHDSAPLRQPYTLLDDVPAPIATSQHLHAYQPVQRAQGLEPTAFAPPQRRVRALTPQQAMYAAPQGVCASSPHLSAPVSVALSYMQDAYGQTHPVYVPIAHPLAHPPTHPHTHSPVHPEYIYAQPYAQAQHYHHQLQLQHRIQPNPPQQPLVYVPVVGQEAHAHALSMHTYAHTHAPAVPPHPQMPQAPVHQHMQAPAPYVPATASDASQAQRWAVSQYAMGVPSDASHQPVIPAVPAAVVGAHDAHLRHAELVRHQYAQSQAHPLTHMHPNAQEVMRTHALALAQAHVRAQPHNGQPPPQHTAPPPTQHAPVPTHLAQHVVPQAQYVQHHRLQHPPGVPQHVSVAPLPPHPRANQHAPLPLPRGLMPPHAAPASHMLQPSSAVQHVQTLPPQVMKPPSAPSLSAGLSSPLAPMPASHTFSEPTYPPSQPQALLPPSTYQYAPSSRPNPPHAAHAAHVAYASRARTEAAMVPIVLSHQQEVPAVPATAAAVTDIASAAPSSLRVPLPSRAPSAPPCIPLPRLPHLSAPAHVPTHAHQPPAQPQRHATAADAHVLPSPALAHAHTTPLPAPADSSASFASGPLRSKTSGPGPSALNQSLHSHRSSASHAQSQSRGRTSLRPGSQRPTPTSSPSHASTPTPAPRALSLLAAACTPLHATPERGGSAYATPAQSLRRSLQSLKENVAGAAVATVGPGPYSKATTPPLPSPLVQHPFPNVPCAPHTQTTPTQATLGAPVPPPTSTAQDVHVHTHASSSRPRTHPTVLVAPVGITAAYAHPYQPQPPRQPRPSTLPVTPAAPGPIFAAASAARALPHTHMKPTAPGRAHSERGLMRPTVPLPAPPTRRPTRALTPAMLVCPFPWEQIHGRQKRRPASLPPAATCTVPSTAAAPPRVLATTSATPSGATVASAIPPSRASGMASHMPHVLAAARASATATTANVAATPAAAPIAATTLPRTSPPTACRPTRPRAALPSTSGAMGTAALASAPVPSSTPIPTPAPASTTITLAPSPATHALASACTAPTLAVGPTKVSPGSTLRAYPLIRPRSRSRATLTSSRSPSPSPSPRARPPAVTGALEDTVHKAAPAASTTPASKRLVSTSLSSPATPISVPKPVRTPAPAEAAKRAQDSTATPKAAAQTPAPGLDESPPMHGDVYCTPARHEVGNARSVSRSSNPHRGSLWQLRKEKGKDASTTRQSNVGVDAPGDAAAGDDSAERVLQPLPEDASSLATTPAQRCMDLPSPKSPLMQLHLHVPDAPASAAREGQVTPPTALCLSGSSSSDAPSEHASALVSTSPAAIATQPCPISPAHPRPQNMYMRAFSPSHTGSQSGKSATPSPAATQPSTPSAKHTAPTATQQLLCVPSLPLSQTPSLGSRTPAHSRAATPSGLALSADAPPPKPFASSPTAGRLASLSSSATSTPSGPLPLRRIPSPPATAPTAPLLIRRASFATAHAQASATGFVPPSQYPFHPPFLPPRSVVLEPYAGNSATPVNATTTPSTHMPASPVDTPSVPKCASATPAISRAPVLGTAATARTTPKASDKALAAVQAVLDVPPAAEGVWSRDVPERPRAPSPSRRNAYSASMRPAVDQRAARAASSVLGPRPPQAPPLTTPARRAPAQRLASVQGAGALAEDTQSTRSAKASGLSTPNAPLTHAGVVLARPANSHEEAPPHSTLPPVEALSLFCPSSALPPHEDSPLPSAGPQPHALSLRTDLSPTAVDARSTSPTSHSGDTPQSVDTTHSQDMHQLAQQLGVSPLRHPSVAPWRKKSTAASAAAQRTLPPTGMEVAVAPREHSSAQSEASSCTRTLPPIDVASIAGSRLLSHVVQVLSPVARPPSASSHHRPPTRTNMSSPHPSSPLSAHAHGSQGRRPSPHGSHTTPAPAQSTPSHMRLHSLAAAGPSPLRLPSTPILPTSTPPHPIVPRPPSTNPSLSSLPHSADHPGGALSAEAHVHAGLELARRAQSHAGDRSLSSSYSSLFAHTDLSFRPALPAHPEHLAFPPHHHHAHAAASQGPAARRRPVLERHASAEAAYTPSLPPSTTHLRTHNRRTSLSQPRPAPLPLPALPAHPSSPTEPLLALPPHPPTPPRAATPASSTNTRTVPVPVHSTRAPSCAPPAARAEASGPITSLYATTPAPQSAAPVVLSASTRPLATPPRPDAPPHNRLPSRVTDGRVPSLPLASAPPPASSFTSTAACATASTLPSALSTAALSLSTTRAPTTVASFTASFSGPLSAITASSGPPSAIASLTSYPSLSPTPSLPPSSTEKAPAVPRLHPYPKPTTAYRSTPAGHTPRPPGPHPPAHPSTPLQTRASAPTATSAAAPSRAPQ